MKNKRNEMKNLWSLPLMLFVMLFMSVGVPAQASDSGKQFVLNLVGTAKAVPAMVPNPEGGEMSANCFTVDLIDMNSGKQVGTADDCLSVTEVIGDAMFVKLIGTTTFHLQQGSFTTQGLTTVAMVQQPTVSPSIGDVTHITGAAGAGNAVIDGTKRFEGAAGTSRLSGLVNLAELGNGYITFDCIFVVNLD